MRQRKQEQRTLAAIPNPRSSYLQRPRPITKDYPRTSASARIVKTTDVEEDTLSPTPMIRDRPGQTALPDPLGRLGRLGRPKTTRESLSWKNVCRQPTSLSARMALRVTSDKVDHFSMRGINSEGTSTMPVQILCKPVWSDAVSTLSARHCGFAVSDCKSAIPRFESGRRLSSQSFLAILKGLRKQALHLSGAWSAFCCRTDWRPEVRINTCNKISRRLRTGIRNVNFAGSSRGVDSTRWRTIVVARNDAGPTSFGLVTGSRRFLDSGALAQHSIDFGTQELAGGTCRQTDVIMP